MFTALRNLFRSRKQRAVLARYDAAQHATDSERHWEGADALSANAANNPAVLRTLRQRARYEVANNSYARGIVLTVANDTIGTGPRLQLLTDDSNLNDLVETLFAEWSNEIGLAEKLRTMRMARAQDGEAFALLSSNPGLRSEVKLDLRLIEADQVSTPSLQPGAVDGIVHDEFGNVVAYHILRHHPGDFGFGAALGDYDTVPASDVIHWFRRDRPGQARGLPDIMPALPLFALLRRYNLAVLHAAETAANFAGVLYTDAPASGMAAELSPYDLVDVERNQLLTIPDGWKMEQFKPEQPATTHETTVRVFLREISRCLSIPLIVAIGDSSGANYASGRLDYQVYHRSLLVDQRHLEMVALDRIFAAWLSEAALIDGFLPGGMGLRRWPHQWFWDGREHVDPAKEATAQTQRLANHTTTLAEEYARRGLDWEEQLRQRAKELAFMRELGISTESVPAADTSDLEEAEAMY